MSSVTPIDEEYEYEGSVSISQTDTKGNILYVNKKFCEISGYEPDELINKEHNIIRHPDMPKAIFARLWETLQSGQVWKGLIKNLRKDGKYYWVSVEILPVIDDNKKTTGYISVTRNASEKEIKENSQQYKKMLAAEE